MLHTKVPPQRAFTTIELLVVIGIIVLLISILVPVVGRVQTMAKTANTAAFISQLSAAIEQYYQDFKAYPGPLSNDEIRRTGMASLPNRPYLQFRFAPTTPGFKQATGAAVDGVERITMSENLVLALLGGLKPMVAGTAYIIEYDPALVGKGPLSLNPGNPKSHAPYLEAINLSWQEIAAEKTGAFHDEASLGNPANPTGADDSIIPEFVDRYGDPMPIIYGRAKVGVSRPNPNAAPTPTDNAVITDDLNFSVGRPGPYDLSQFIGYTQPPSGGTPIGVGKKLPTYISAGSVPNQPNPGHAAPHHGLRSVNPLCTLINPPPASCGYLYPYDAYAYFRDPALSGPQETTNSRQAPRQKDKFILISAGPDRIYGTNDDVTNFGPVNP